jgi:hypothetical protein
VIVLDVDVALDQLEKEKSLLIQHIGNAREAEEEYNRVINLVHPDQVIENNQAIVEQLLAEEDQEKLELDKLEHLLLEKTKALEANRNRIAQETIRLQELGAKKADAEFREAEAIRLSKNKDPQVEELGKWYKETMLLLHALNDIEKMTVHSDSRIEIVYGGFPQITAMYELFTGSDAKQFVDVQVPYFDIVERESQFARHSAATGRVPHHECRISICHYSDSSAYSSLPRAY